METIIKDPHEDKFFCCKETGGNPPNVVAIEKKHYLYLSRKGLWENIDGNPASDYYFSTKTEIQQILQLQQ